MQRYLETLVRAAIRYSDEQQRSISKAISWDVGVVPSSTMLANQTGLDAAAAMQAALNATRGVAEKYHERVQRASLPIQYVILLRWDEYHDFFRRNGLQWPIEDSTRQELFARFASVAKRAGVRKFATPTCSAWMTVRSCWNKQANLTTFKRFVLKNQTVGP